MKKLILLAMMLAACGAPSSDARPSGLLMVPADDEIHALLLAADAAWEAAGVSADRIVVGEPGDEGGVPATWASTTYITAKCPPAAGKSIGCLDIGGEGLLVAFDAPREKLALIVRHELGHTLRGVAEEWHLPESECAADRSAATMCANSVAVALTAADGAFICSSETAPCEGAR